MIRLGTTERACPWGVLRSTDASKVKFALAEKAPAMARITAG